MSHVVPMSIVIRLGRAAAVASLVASAGCLHSPPGAQATASFDTFNTCDGEPYLDIDNRSQRGANLYANINGQRKYIGTVGPTDTRFSLVGTAAEHPSGRFGQAWGYAVPIDPDPNTPRGGPNEATISMTLRCDRSIKPASE